MRQDTCLCACSDLGRSSRFFVQAGLCDCLQIVLMGLIESYRANGGIDDDQGLDRLYPGGDYFDPLGLADDPDSFAELRVSTLPSFMLHHILFYHIVA